MPPRVAPQQVVVIPIPNAKMSEDDKQVGLPSLPPATHADLMRVSVSLSDISETCEY